jgi:hypothetical protein
MAKYKVTKPCFINGKRGKVGDIIEFEGVAPSYLKAVEKPEAQKSKKKK